jgi:pimeloyl-ACP methyl ester carboxylesterase
MVLVHGASLGGWSWFKVATPLRAAGYRVDTPDLAASGVDPRPLREAAPTFRDYTAPLLDLLAALPDGERVVLVGHSLGGVSIALAAEMFPDKVAAAVFLCAFMPGCAARPSHVLEEVRRSTTQRTSKPAKSYGVRVCPSHAIFLDMMSFSRTGKKTLSKVAVHRP